MSISTNEEIVNSIFANSEDQVCEPGSETEVRGIFSKVICDLFPVSPVTIGETVDSLDKYGWMNGPFDAVKALKDAINGCTILKCPEA